MRSIAHTFLAGHAVRVLVASSNFARLHRNPSVIEDAARADRLEAADQQVRVGGGKRSRLVLPVVSGS
jgi:predicted acyl esterase